MWVALLFFTVWLGVWSVVTAVSVVQAVTVALPASALTGALLSALFVGGAELAAREVLRVARDHRDAVEPPTPEVDLDGARLRWRAGRPNLMRALWAGALGASPVLAGGIAVGAALVEQGVGSWVGGVYLAALAAFAWHRLRDVGRHAEGERLAWTWRELVVRGGALELRDPATSSEPLRWALADVRVEAADRELRITSPEGALRVPCPLPEEELAPLVAWIRAASQAPDRPLPEPPAELRALRRARARAGEAQPP